MTNNVIQPSFAAGELSPGLAARVDIAKYHVGAALLQNFFVDYKGGAASRPGTQFIGITVEPDLPTWLHKFVFSATQQYVLAFSDFRLAFIRNPLTDHYPNGSNSGFIESSPGVPYVINTPYPASNLADLKFAQSADVLQITHPGHPRMVLQRHGETNWTLTEPAIGATIASPGGVYATISDLPANSTDPQTTTYLYTVTSVDKDGEESTFGSVSYIAGLDMAVTPGSVTVVWNRISTASYYNVYKTIPGQGDKVPPLTASFGFCGIAYGNMFVDTNIIPDFSKAPPLHSDPFSPQQILRIDIHASSSDWPVGATQINVTDTTGGGAFVIPVINNDTRGGTGAIVDVFIANPGENYTNPTFTAVGGGTTFIAVAECGPAHQWPTSVAYHQQRLVVAGTTTQPTGVYGSKTGFYNNFDKSNPIVDNDSFTFVVAASEVNAILHMLAMPGGLVLFTNSSIQQLTGGSSTASNPSAITPASAVVVPQSHFGSSDVRPLVINNEIMYVQATGGVVHNLAYNLFTFIYEGKDISHLASHLFHPKAIVDWDYQHVPFKIIWTVMNDGSLLSLTYMKEQDIWGWTRHLHGAGSFRSVTVIREGTEDAVYFAVERDGVFMIERLCGRVYTDISDAWCVDSGLSYQGPPTTTLVGLDHLEGREVAVVGDGVALGRFIVTGSSVTLPVAVSKAVAGLYYTPRLQTVQLDLGNEMQTIQGKRKRVAAVSLRVRDTATEGLKVGTTFNTLVPFVPNVSSTDNMKLPVNGLVTTDMRLIIDPSYNVPGQICIEQGNPLPVTILGVIPEIVVGDNGGR